MMAMHLGEKHAALCILELLVRIIYRIQSDEVGIFSYNV